MCEIYNVGDEECCDVYADEKFRWIVYVYENYGYEGGGEAVGYNIEDGLLYVQSLSHCSCYGPMDDGFNGATKYTVEEYLRVKDNVLDYESMDCVKKKVHELLS